MTSMCPTCGQANGGGKKPTTPYEQQLIAQQIQQQEEMAGGVKPRPGFPGQPGFPPEPNYDRGDMLRSEELLNRPQWTPPGQPGFPQQLQPGFPGGIPQPEPNYDRGDMLRSERLLNQPQPPPGQPNYELNNFARKLAERKFAGRLGLNSLQNKVINQRKF